MGGIQPSQGLPLPSLERFLEMALKHTAPPRSVLVTDRRGVPKGKASVSKPRAFWQPCCNCGAFSGMIDLREAIRKECEISGFLLPAGG